MKQLEEICANLENVVKFLCPHGVVIRGVYEHFKGGRYVVTGLTRDANDWEGELRVKYVQLTDVTHEATRPLSEFLSEVDKPDYKGPRFILVGVI